MKKEMLTCYFLLAIRKNHIAWWLEDNIVDALHRTTDRIDSAYWGLFWRFRGGLS